MEDFNPLHDIKALTAALDDEPSEQRHVGVLPLEWLAKQAVELSTIVDTDARTVAI